MFVFKAIQGIWGEVRRWYLGCAYGKRDVWVKEGILELGVAEAVAEMRCLGKHHMRRQNTRSEVLKCSSEKGQVDKSL